MTTAAELAARIVAAGGSLYTQKGPATLPEMTGPEVQEYLKVTDVVSGTRAESRVAVSQ